jgi:GNAT superfamily N-acetyltransferase
VRQVLLLERHVDERARQAVDERARLYVACDTDNQQRFRGGRIRPEDAEQERAFVLGLSDETRYFRFFYRLHDLTPAMLARFTQVDYDREMAFIATCESQAGRLETIGVARAIADPDNISAEFAIIVRSDLKGQGLGAILLRKLIAYCRSRGTRELVGEALSDNQRLLGLVRHFGGAIDHSDQGTTRFVELGKLKGTDGDQNYDIPAGLDLNRYRAVTIWCYRFAVNFATAPLTPTS